MKVTTVINQDEKSMDGYLDISEGGSITDRVTSA